MKKMAFGINQPCVIIGNSAMIQWLHTKRFTFLCTQRWAIIFEDTDKAFCVAQLLIITYNSTKFQNSAKHYRDLDPGRKVFFLTAMGP